MDRTQDLVRSLQLSILALQLIQAARLIREWPGPLALVPLRRTDPVALRLIEATDLLDDGLDRPRRSMLVPVVEHHPHGSLPRLGGIRLCGRSTVERAIFALVCHRALAPASKPGYKRYLVETAAGELRIDRVKVAPDARYDGKYVLMTNELDLPPEELVLGYRDIWKAERAFRSMKGLLDLEPVHHIRPSASPPTCTCACSRTC